jgi:hypothetical protein
MPQLIFNPRYDARQNHMMIEPASKVNRAFSAGDFGISRILGRCPRFATANLSCGGLEVVGAPLALIIGLQQGKRRTYVNFQMTKHQTTQCAWPRFWR